MKNKINEAIEGLKSIRRNTSKELSIKQLEAISFTLDFLIEEKERKNNK